MKNMNTQSLMQDNEYNNLLLRTVAVLQWKF